MKAILLMMLGLSMLNAELTKNGDVVSDTSTGLEWQDDATPSRMTWQGSIDYCEALSLDGGNWRLPNLNELTSLVDDTKSNPSIDTTVFENTISNYYWSSTTNASLTSYAWVVYFNVGNQYNHYKTLSLYVRCVRGGQ